VLIIIALMEVVGLALISFLIINLNNLDSILSNSNFFQKVLIFFKLSSYNSSYVFCILIIGYSIVNIIVSIASIRYISIYSQILGANIKSKVVEYFLYLDWAKLTGMPTSKSMSRVINDGNEVSDILYFLMHLFSKFILALLIISFLLIFNTQLTIILVTMLSATYIIIFFGSKPIITSNSLSQTRLLDSILNVVKNMFGSLKEIIFYNSHKEVLSKFSELNHSFAKAKGSNMALAQMPRSFIDSLILIALVGLLLFTKINNVDPTIFFATFSIYGIAALKLLPAFQNIFYFSHEIYVRLPYLKNISDLFLEIDQTIKIRTNDDEKPIIIKDSIVFKDISFKYMDANVHSLESINLSIKNHEKIAIVGPSGSGKSTFIDLLLGFMEPTDGQILIDSKDFPFDDFGRYRLNFSYVPQKVFFLEASIKANITFGTLFNQKNKIDLDKILLDSELKELVDNLPRGLDTLLSDDNQIVSGGQKQCIGIARALVRGGNILILDEATSAMDTNLEKKIYKSIFKSNFNNIISITHKPSLLKLFDKIYVFREGTIEASGSFEYLRKNNKFFINMLEDFSAT
jgi:HlyD family secretion protein